MDEKIHKQTHHGNFNCKLNLFAAVFLNIQATFETTVPLRAFYTQTF
jgi:hypothetical protein